MATVKRESIGNLHDKLVVTIAKEDYLPSFEKSLKQYSKSVTMPGFRKGFVPVGMVRKMHGQSLFIDEVLRITNRTLEDYLKENKPSIFGQPLPISSTELEWDMNKAGDFDFEFEIGLKPEFEITPLNKKGSITRYKIRIDEKMIDEEIGHLRKRAAKVEHPEILEEESDIAYISFQSSAQDGTIAEGTEEMQDVRTLKELPAAIASALKGKKKGEEIIFKPSEMLTEEELPIFSSEVLKKEADDIKDAYYKLTLTNIGRPVERELDAAFFEEIFPNEGIEDEEAFRAKLKGELEKEVQRIASDRVQNELFETLVHDTPIELPVEFLKNWLKKSGEKEKTDEEVEKEFPSFDHQLRWTLISDKLVTDNKIEVSLDEVMTDIKSKVMGYFGMGMEDDAPWMDSYLEKMAKDEKAVDETYRRLLFDKLFKLLEEVMEVEEKEISQEEFSKLPSSHHH